LGMSASAPSTAAAWPRHPYDRGYASYQIPSELLASPICTQSKQLSMENATFLEGSQGGSLPRGGWQGDEAILYDQNPENVYANPYDAMRQGEFEQLHQQMYVHSDMVPEMPQVREQR
jgi:hypothetical protein